MEFKDFAQNEASALLERLAGAAQAATEKIRAETRGEDRAVRQQADGLREQAEKETARASSLEADLDTVIEAHKSVDADRLRIEEELRTAASTSNAPAAEISQLEEVLESEMAQKSVLETALADKASIDADLVVARAALDALRSSSRRAEGSSWTWKRSWRAPRPRNRHCGSSRGTSTDCSRP